VAAACLLSAAAAAAVAATAAARANCPELELDTQCLDALVRAHCAAEMHEEALSLLRVEPFLHLASGGTYGVLLAAAAEREGMHAALRVWEASVHAGVPAAAAVVLMLQREAARPEPAARCVDTERREREERKERERERESERRDRARERRDREERKERERERGEKGERERARERRDREERKERDRERERERESEREARERRETRQSVGVLPLLILGPSPRRGAWTQRGERGDRGDRGEKGRCCAASAHYRPEPTARCVDTQRGERGDREERKGVVVLPLLILGSSPPPGRRYVYPLVTLAHPCDAQGGTPDGWHAIASPNAMGATYFTRLDAERAYFVFTREAAVGAFLAVTQPALGARAFSTMVAVRTLLKPLLNSKDPN
jgi:hypothetical protein